MMNPDSMKEAIIEEYWLKKLAGELPEVSLPLEKPDDSQKQKQETRLYLQEIPAPVSAQLARTARYSDKALSILILSGLQIVLNRYTDTHDLVVGTVVPPAMKTGEHNRIIFCRNRVPDHMTLKEFFIQTRDELLETFNYWEYSLDNLVETLGTRNGTGSPGIFKVAFLYEPFQEKNQDINRFELVFIVSPHHPHHQPDPGPGFCLQVQYPWSPGNREIVRRFSQNLITTLQEMLDNVDKQVGKLEILSEEEKHELLYGFNATGAAYPQDKTLHELFREQVDQTPDHIALLGSEGTRGLAPLRLAPLPTPISIITYQELNKKADQFAYKLKEKGIKPGAIAAIMLNRTIHMMVGLLGILKAGAAYLPLDPEYPEARIKYIIEKSSTSVLVTQKNLFDKYKKDNKDMVYTGEIIDIFDERLYREIPNEKIEKQEPHFSSLAPAYVIYTSGSTGNPKGVMVPHKNAVNFITGMTSVINFLTGKSILALTTISFDIFFLETLLPITRGMKVIVTDETQQKDPQLLEKIILYQQIDMLQLTPSRLQLLLSFKDDLDYLRSVKELIIGGEAFPVHLFKQVKEKYTGKIYNVYGPTETTIWSTIKDLTLSTAGELTIGTPIANTQVYIVDRHSRVLPLGVVGELLIGGDGVASGYLNNPQLTAEKFCLRRPGALFVKTAPGPRKNFLLHSPQYPITPSPHHPIYRTGDLARWLPSGEIECLGREDQQVKIRGFRIELEEIEAQLVKHEDIKEAVVTAMGDEQSGKYLAAYLVPVPGIKGKEFDVSELREFLQQHLPDYMIPSYFVRLDEIPLTPNGKVDRRRLPGPRTTGIEGSPVYHPPRNPVEKKLVDIWSKVLGIDKNTIGIDDNFFERGGHSLRAIVMTTLIHKEFDVMIPLADIFKAPSIRGISLYLGDSVQEKYAAIEPAEAKEYYPVSSAQKRLYILHQLDPNSLGYNLPKVFVIEGIPDELRLENTFRQLIKRHESFRTRFGMEGGEPVQRIDEVEEVDFSIEYYQSAAEIHHLFIRPFDLSKAPLLRVGLIKNDENGHLLLIDMHHIITDGTSGDLLAQEFTALYSAQDLSELRLQYKDYAVWQNRPRQHQVLEHQKSYWVELYSDEVPVLHLPTDYPRPPIQSFEGSAVDFRLTAEAVRGLKRLAKETESTLFMSILSLFNVLLSRLDGQEDIVVGTPAASRRHADLGHIIGIFINTLALRNFPSGHKTFKEFLKEVKKHALEAYENQEYPFEELVEQLVINRDLSRNPLFDAMFILHNEFQPRPGTIPGPAKMDLNLKSYEYEKRTSQFDLTLVGFEGENHLVFRIEYCTRLFKEETVRRFIKYFKEIVSIVLQDPWVKLAEIEIIPEEEKNQVLYEFNNTRAAYPQDKTLHELFREQVERTPDHVALLGIHEIPEIPQKNHYMSHMSHMSYLSYNELNKKADQLAYKLKEKGVKPGTIAVIMVDRTIHMMVGLLGILKAGAAYLPLDPEYPGKRIDYILANSNTEVLVTTPPLQAKIKAEAARGVVFSQWKSIKIINIEKDYFNFPGSISSTLASTCRVSPAKPAYVIYTSGSTGNPKGVVIGHQNVVNFITGMTAVIDFSPGQAILAVTTISFDIFFLETLLPLTRGLKVVIAGESHQKDPVLLEQLILKSQVNMVQLTPSRLQLLLSLRGNLQGLAGVEVLMVGGEAFPSLLLEKVKEHFQGKIYNMYGPTETTIWSAVKELTHTLPGEITIGSPIANTQVYIVDKNMHLQPLGVTGELLIAGDGVALGYLNNVELTAEKFKINRSYRSNKTYIKLYQTGDLSRWLSTGEIEFLGRLDHQVKIRGFRIELEEIEEQLLKLERFKEAVVVLKTSSSAQKYLCAYMVPHPGDSSDLPDTIVLREKLSVKLPPYMIPAYFMYMEKIPLTPNGKIDRKALPEPDRSGSHQGTPGTFIAPATDNEKTIARLWKEILHLEKVGIYENFFDLGGNSMNLVQLNWKLKEILGIDMPVALMFRNLTIDFLSKHLDQEKIKVQNREKQVTALDRAQDTLKDTLSKLIIE